MPRPDRVLLSILCACLLAGCAAPPPGQPASPAAATTSVPAAPRPERPRAEQVRDQNLETAVARRLAEADKTAFAAVTVQTYESRVVLIGAVQKPMQRRRAAELAQGVEGVTAVANELVLAEAGLFPAFTRDPARERTVETALRADAGISPAWVVRVVNGVAFLAGPQPAAGETDRLKTAALGVDGIKWVVITGGR